MYNEDYSFIYPANGNPAPVRGGFAIPAVNPTGKTLALGDVREVYAERTLSRHGNAHDNNGHGQRRSLEGRKLGDREPGARVGIFSWMGRIDCAR